MANQRLGRAALQLSAEGVDAILDSLRAIRGGLDQTAGSAKNLSQIESFRVLQDLAGFAAEGVKRLASEVVDLAKRGSEIAGVKDNFEALARGIGETGSQMLAVSRDATKNLVSDLDLMASANKALLLGLPVTSDSLGDLAKTAVTLGRAMKQDATKSLDDLITALGRSSPMILDNLGLTVKVGEANEQYARKLGKTAEQLTETEKKTAFYEAAMEAARAKVDELGEIQLTLGDRIRQAEIEWQNLMDGLAIGITQSPALAAGFDAIAESLSSAFGESRDEQVRTLIGLIEDLVIQMVGLAAAGVETASQIAQAFKNTEQAIFGVLGALTEGDVAILQAELNKREALARELKGVDPEGDRAMRLRNEQLREQIAILSARARSYQETATAAGDAATAAARVGNAIQEALAKARAEMQRGQDAPDWQGPLQGPAAIQPKPEDVSLTAEQLKKLAAANEALRGLTQGLTADQQKLASEFHRVGLSAEHIATKLRAPKEAVEQYLQTLEFVTRTNREFASKGAQSWSDFAKAIEVQTARMAKAVVSNALIEKDARLKLDELVRKSTMSRLEFELDAIVRAGENQKLAIDQSVQGWERAAAAIDELVTGQLQEFALQSEEVTAALASMAGVFPQLLPFLTRFTKGLEDGGAEMKTFAETAFKGLSDLSRALAQLAQIAGEGGLGRVVQSIGEVVASMDLAHTAGGNIRKGLEQITIAGDGAAAKLTLLTTNLASYAAAMAQAVNTTNRAQAALGGFSSTASLAAGLGLNGLASFALGAAGGVIGIAFAMEKARAEKRRYRDALNEVRIGFVKTFAEMANLRQLFPELSREWEQLLSVNYNEDALNRMAEIVAEIRDRVSEANDEFAPLLARASELGVRLPSGILDSLEALRNMGVLLGQNADLVDQLLSAPVADWKKMQALAEQFGIDIDSLGGQFQQLKSNASAGEILNAFETLTRGGASVGGVLQGMRDEISHVVNESIRLGTTIPENMRHLIDELARTHQLYTANRLAANEWAQEMLKSSQEMPEGLRHQIREFENLGRLTMSAEDIWEQYGRNAPESVKKVIEELLRQAELVGEDGGIIDSIEELERLKFGEPIKTEFEIVTDELRNLIDALTDMANAIRNMPTLPPGVIPPGTGAGPGDNTTNPGFAHGGVAGRDWARPTSEDIIPAWLKPGELVLAPSLAREFAEALRVPTFTPPAFRLPEIRPRLDLPSDILHRIDQPPLNQTRPGEDRLIVMPVLIPDSDDPYEIAGEMVSRFPDDYAADREFVRTRMTPLFRGVIRDEVRSYFRGRR